MPKNKYQLNNIEFLRMLQNLLLKNNKNRKKKRPEKKEEEKRKKNINQIKTAPKLNENFKTSHLSNQLLIKFRISHVFSLRNNSFGETGFPKNNPHV